MIFNHLYVFVKFFLNIPLMVLGKIKCRLLNAIMQDEILPVSHGEKKALRGYHLRKYGC